MKFENRVKGGVTQTLLKCLLDDAGYRVVPFGIEEAVRELVCLSREEYQTLDLPHVLRKMPDFFVTDKAMKKAWLVEVKFRKRWDEQTRSAIKKDMSSQFKFWLPLHLVVCVQEPVYEDKPNMPYSYIGAAELMADQDGDLAVVSNCSGLVKWDNVSWGDFPKIQTVFPGLRSRYREKTIEATMRAIQSLSPDA